eukprot:TRINITY_DN6527_c0_g1_i1.p1 TRINITY_DN6527_c0_g1~~TRINITY_DN6527_c0_g1_i1.p1  ORF type:complete len:130 (+),score=6.78 TRINITY_DN6527_c0_g1_i1:371-760(+)
MSQLVEAAFHSIPGYNHTIWTPQSTNTFTVSSMNENTVCVTQVTLKLRYSTLLMADYDEVINHLFWSGVLTSLLTVLLPCFFFGRFLWACRSQTNPRIYQTLPEDQALATVLLRVPSSFAPLGHSRTLR